MILSGYPRLTGATLAERMAELRDHQDWVRRVAMTEPRGHRDMFRLCVGAARRPPLPISPRSSWMQGGTTTCAAMLRWGSRA